MKNSKKISALALILWLSACSQEPPPVKPDTGRPETRTLEAASAVGYDGKAIRKKVDGALDANDAHNAELEQQMQQNQ
ncbi:MAG: hypothetical protein Q7S87_07205 [Agitococcus sp.]|nr:hypothetical protein [Agitococcus sp.]